MIRIEHLKKEYPNVTPLKDVNVVINDGDVISVIGPSGTGKSTLLRCINKLETPTSGHIWINDTDVTDPKCDLDMVRRHMGMVFQSFNLFGHMTVIENIMFSPITLLDKPRQEAYDEGMKLLRMVGLAQKAMNYPDELSGGQKQRIAIARTLAMDPEIILFDEPTSALDPTMVGEVQAVIRELSTTGKTLMIVTHEMDFARSICNRVFYMDEGGVYEDGSPDQIFDDPQRENTRRFVRKLKILELEIENRDYDFYQMSEKIVHYGNRNQIPVDTVRHISLAYEELVHQILVQALEDPRMHITIEYSAKDDHAVMSVDYNNPGRYKLTEDDKLPRSVMDAAVSEIRHEENPEGAFANRIVMTIK